MMPMVVNEQAPVPQLSYHRAQAHRNPALHIDAFGLTTFFGQLLAEGLYH